MILKFNFFSLLFLLGTFFSNAQEMVVEGHIEGLSEPEIAFMYVKGDSMKADTVKLNNGKFLWRTKLMEPQKVYIFAPYQYFQFFAEPGHIFINGHKDSLQQIRVTGSRLNDSAKEYEYSLQDIVDRQNILQKKWVDESKEGRLKIDEQLDSLHGEKRVRAIKYIALHPCSPVSVDLVSGMAILEPYETVQEAFDLLSPYAQRSMVGHYTANRLAVLKRSAKGSPMLNFTQKTPQGKTVRFDEFKGKYVFVDLWSSWCAPCRAENPNVLRLYNKYKAKNFTVVGVSIDQDVEKWTKAIEADKMPWTQVSDLKGRKNELMQYFGIVGIPSSLLVDPQGNIIDKDLRGAALQNRLSELFD